MAVAPATPSAPEAAPLLRPRRRPGPLGWLLGQDRAMRSRVLSVMLCALMYAICSLLAYGAARIGMMRAEAPPVILLVSLPVHAVIYAFVRSGWTLRLHDPALMIPQNLFALAVIAYGYTALAPSDRGVVMVLLSLVIVFGMYTHTPRQAMLIAGSAITLLGVAMAVLTHTDPAYYPPALELLHFELLLGSLPAMALVARQIAIWRDRARQQRADLQAAVARVQHLATHDPLTGLYNRRHMEDLLAQVMANAQGEKGEGYALALLDIDHFKRINDQHGHRTGDEALQGFAGAALTVLRQAAVARPPDLIARWGGEEFLVLLPTANADGAARALRRLRQHLLGAPVSGAHPELRLQFSAGVAVWRPGLSTEALIDAADKALYRAKQEGRDRVVRA